MYANGIIDVNDDPLYIEMDNELSKYKTLSHSEIDWQKVYDNNIKLLEKTIDTRVLRGFILSIISINKDDVFVKLDEVMHHYHKVWIDIYKKLLSENNKQAKIQNKFFIDSVNELIEANNSYKVNISAKIVEEINDMFIVFNTELKTNFQQMTVNIKTDNADKEVINKSSNQVIPYKSIDSMDIREYREYFFSLGRNLLEKNILNLTGYSLFWEGVWGKIISEVPNKNNITEIRYPEQNTIDIVSNIKEFNYENINTALKNIFLNPFWFEGYKIFIDYSVKVEKVFIAEYMKTLVKLQLEKYKWLTKLCFSNQKPFCSTELYDFFCSVPEVKKDDNVKIEIENKKLPKEIVVNVKNKKDKNDFKSLKARLSAINEEIDGSLKSKVDGLIEIAETMKVNGFNNSADILYQEVLNIMDTTLLKDYLNIEYINIKNIQNNDK